MKTMGLGELYLVNPALYPNAEATARASGADDLLARAVVCDSLDDALRDCTLVVGSSARLRTRRWPQLEPRAFAEKAVDEGLRGRVALVFGRERTGLTNEELDPCKYLRQAVTAPTSSARRCH